MGVKESVRSVMKHLDFSQEWFDANEGIIWNLEQELKSLGPGARLSLSVQIRVRELRTYLKNIKELRFLKSKLLILIPRK